jgi:aldehyde:ferredoxin oxidoreductase
MGSLAGDTLDIRFDEDLGYPSGIESFSIELADGLAATAPRRQFEDTLGICLFTASTRFQIIIDVLNAATGWDFTIEEALSVGARILNLMRSYSIRHGISPENDDTISPRLREPQRDGPTQGTTIAPVFAEMRRRYYGLMGWDPETSKPLPETLKRLGLEPIVRELWG